MALISNPFVANVNKQLSPNELVQAIRADLVGEYEAIIGYEAHAMAAQDERVKQALHNIADEERKHVGQLEELLSLLDPQESQLINQGKQTIRQQISQSAGQTPQQGSTISNPFPQ